MNRIYQGKVTAVETRVAFVENKKGAAKAPVQELRFMSGSSCDLRSLADRFLRTADPQVLISTP